MKNKKVYLTNFEKKVLKNDFHSTFLWNYKKVEHILNNSSENKKFILFIFIIENMNRGNIFNYIFEKALLFLFPNLVKKYDLSIGPFQMKPSFLELYAPYVDISKFFDLDYCILVLDNFLAYTNYLESGQQLSLYHSGESENDCKSTHIYIYLYKWFKNNF
ncbi:hypothetical protein ACO1DJ_11270 [Staphylococcus epidermidis]|uniref:hypothetical protein n=1 Tax=Staphylococcus epidermidis TaxID=1282 RepID=UPI003BF6F144